MEAIVFEAYEDRWEEGNEAGEGFAVGLETDDAEQAIKREGDRLIHSDMSPGRRIAIGGKKRSNGSLRYYIVMDAHGPWAVWL